MKKIYFYIENNLPLIIFFLFSIPNFSLPIPAIKTTHIFTSLLLFIYFLKYCIKKEIKVDTENTLFLIFIAGSSISIINVLNIFSFFSFFKNIITGFIYFLVSKYYFQKKKKIKNFLIILTLSMIFNIIYAVTIYTGLDSYLFLSYIVDPIYLRNVIERRVYLDKYFIELNSFYFLPTLLVVFILAKSKFWLLINYIIATIYLYLSFLSNYRIILFITLISFLFFFSYVFKSIKRKGIRILLILTSLVVIFVAYKTIPRNTITRVIDPGIEEFRSIETRINLTQQSISMFKSNVLFGVGLGNFYDYADHSTVNRITTSAFKHLYIITNNDPHNIIFRLLAETGMVGLFSLMALLFYWIKKDWKTVAVKNNITEDTKKLYIGVALSFYLQILFALTTPFYTINNLISFFVSRALLNGIVRTKKLF